MTTGLGRGISRHLDHLAFVADGTDDTTDGLMTGAFVDAGVPVVTAVGGNTTAQAIEEEDILNLVDAVAPAALQRSPRFWVAPAIYTKLLRVKDGSGAKLVRFENGQPSILGWPVTLASIAPSTNAAAQKIMLFGCGEAVLVAVREMVGIDVSESCKLDYNMLMVRAVVRAHCQVLAPTWLAVLKTAAA
jgi:HK97 family phage major capsid protein